MKQLLRIKFCFCIALINLCFANYCSAQKFDYQSSEYNPDPKFNAVDIINHFTCVANAGVCLPADVTRTCEITGIYGNPLPPNENIKTARAFVKFQIDHNNNNIYEKYTYRIKVHVKGYKDLVDPNIFSEFDDILTISYKPDSLNAYQDVQIKSYYGFYKLDVTVLDLYDITCYENGDLGSTATTCCFLPSVSSSATSIDLNALPVNGVFTSNNLACLNKVASNWILETGIEIQKVDYPINYANVSNCNSYGSRLVTNGTPLTAVNNQNSLQVTWSDCNNPLIGKQIGTPALYELEWIYIDNYKVQLNNGQMTVNEKPINLCVFDFSKNATRVITNNPHYEIPLIYKKGYIVYRVRMFMPDKIKNYSESKLIFDWSLMLNSGIISNLLPTTHFFKITEAHEVDTKNWNYQLSFAEEGKNKQVLSYFDGLLKNRQSLTKFNSRPNLNIVTEPFYDYEGRVGIQTLPTPVHKFQGTTGAQTPNNYFGYVDDFANLDATTPIQAKDFDDVNKPISSVNLFPALDPNNALATKYYSPSNPMLDPANYPAGATVPNKYKAIPNAQGFPLIHTRYSSFDAKRIMAQGGAGKELQIGSGNESKFYYSDPSQSEIDKYFGTNVGLSSYYEKMITRDPNGQRSFTINNNLGKPIITGLLGFHTAGGKIAPLDDVIFEDPISIDWTKYATENLLANTTPLWQGTTRNVSKTFYKETGATTPVSLSHTFALPSFQPCSNNNTFLNIPLQYSIVGVSEAEPSTTSTSIYNSITLAGTPLSSTNFTVNIHQPSATLPCLTTSSVLAQPISATTNNLVSGLKDGDVNISYDVHYNIADVNAAVDLYVQSPAFNNMPCYKTFDMFLQEGLANVHDDCDDNDADEASESECALLEESMMSQMMPGGLYGKFERYGKNKIVCGDQNSIFKIVGWINKNNTSTTYFTTTGITFSTPPYGNPHVGLSGALSTSYNYNGNIDDFFDAITKDWNPVYEFQLKFLNAPAAWRKTNPISSFTCDQMPGETIDYNTSPETFIEAMQFDCGKTFVNMHPEFCTYKSRYCYGIAELDFETKLTNISSFVEAQALGLSTLDEILLADPFVVNAFANNYMNSSRNANHISAFMHFKDNVNGNLKEVPVNIYALYRAGIIPDNVYDGYKFILGNLTRLYTYPTYNANIELNVLVMHSTATTAEKDAYYAELIGQYIALREKAVGLIIKDVSSICNTTDLLICNTISIPDYDNVKIFKDYMVDEETLGADAPATNPPNAYADAINNTPSILNLAEQKNLDLIHDYAVSLMTSLTNCTSLTNSTPISQVEINSITASIEAQCIANINLKGLTNEYLYAFSPKDLKILLQTTYSLAVGEICNEYLAEFKFNPGFFYDFRFKACNENWAQGFKDWNRILLPEIHNMYPFMFATNNAASPNVPIFNNVISGNSATIDFNAMGSSDLFDYMNQYITNIDTRTTKYFNNPTGPDGSIINKLSSFGADCDEDLLGINSKISQFKKFINEYKDINGNKVTLTVDRVPNTVYGYVTEAYLATLLNPINYPDLFSNTNNSVNGLNSFCIENKNFNNYNFKCAGIDPVLKEVYITFDMIAHTKDGFRSPSLAGPFHNYFIVKQKLTIKFEGNPTPPPSYECITSTEFFKAYNQYRSDVLAAYNVTGKGHPAYKTTLRNYMNNYFKKQYDVAKYLDFLDGINYAATDLAPAVPSYIVLESDKIKIAAIENNINNHNTSIVIGETQTLADMPRLNVRDAVNSRLYLDMSNFSLKDAKLRTFLNKLDFFISALGGGITIHNQRFYTGTNAVGEFYVLNNGASFALPVGLLPSNFAVSTYSLDIRNYSNPSPLIPYLRFELSHDGTATPTQINAVVYDVKKYLFNQDLAYQCYFNYQSSVTPDNLELPKQNYLDYAKSSAMQSISNHDLLIMVDLPTRAI
jgi:hypothetical protein